MLYLIIKNNTDIIYWILLATNVKNEELFPRDSFVINNIEIITLAFHVEIS